MNDNTIRDLKELYDKKLLYYWCNATGDLNIPGHSYMSVGEKEDLPPAIAKLYDTFWNELDGVQKYVVTLENVNGMAMNILLDDTYMEDIVDRIDENSSFPWAKLTQIRKDAGIKAASALQKLLPAGEVFYGCKTDPDGDEVLVFLPDDQCEQHIGTVIKIMDENFYQLFEEQVKERMAQEVTPYTMPTVEEFIAYLAKKLALPDVYRTTTRCFLCVRQNNCDRKVNIDTCAGGIEEWLKKKAIRCAKEQKVEKGRPAAGFKGSIIVSDIPSMMENGETSMTVCQELYPQPTKDAAGMWKWKGCQWMDGGLGFPTSGIDDYAPFHVMDVLPLKIGSKICVIADIRVTQTDVGGSSKWVWVYALTCFEEGDMSGPFNKADGTTNVE